MPRGLRGLLSTFRRACPVSDSALEAKTDEVVGRLNRAPSVAIAAGRRLLDRSLTSSLSEQLMAEARELRRCAVSEDFREGIGALVAKRKPEFQGR
jgi:2-(1,2-epoxy-1,2-dihydrophenyl)acetyl-CoA isomerase